MPRPYDSVIDLSTDLRLQLDALVRARSTPQSSAVATSSEPLTRTDPPTTSSQTNSAATALPSSCG